MVWVTKLGYSLDTSSRVISVNIWSVNVCAYLSCSRYIPFITIDIHVKSNVTLYVTKNISPSKFWQFAWQICHIKNYYTNYFFRKKISYCWCSWVCMNSLILATIVEVKLCLDLFKNSGVWCLSQCRCTFLLVHRRPEQCRLRVSDFHVVEEWWRLYSTIAQLYGIFKLRLILSL